MFTPHSQAYTHYNDDGMCSSSWYACEDQRQFYQRNQSVSPVYAAGMHHVIQQQDGNHAYHSQQNLERFLTEPGPQPFSPTVLASQFSQTDASNSTREYYHQQQYSNGPWPRAVDFSRQISPESSNTSTYGWCPSPQIVPRSAESHPALAYGSPHSHTDWTYTEQNLYGASSTQSSFGGGHCITLSQIENSPDQMETQLDEDDGAVKSEEFQEHECTLIKSELEPRYEHDSGMGESILGDSPPRYAESVHLMSPKIEDSEFDSDYKPQRRSARKVDRWHRDSKGSAPSSPTHTRRSQGHRRNGSALTSVAAEGIRKKKRRPSSASQAKQGRPFPCPLAIYGCTSTFPTKNEWKRHVSTQHVRTGFWRCDMCPPTTDATQTEVYFNDFNRKDLFTQHLRRMHASESKNGSPPSVDSGIPEVNEDTLPAHQQRCYLELREEPRTSHCLFCPQTFRGDHTWSDRMEHVGGHLEKDPSLGTSTERWRPDDVLEKYLIREGLIERRGQGWIIGEGTPLEDNDASAPHDDVDADGEDDE